MKREYKFTKKVFTKKNIDFMQIFFNNGEFISINGKEVVDISVKLYDKLILENNTICPVVESGSIKLLIVNKSNFIYASSFVYDRKKYNKSRKNYIEKRLCIESGIKCIRLFDENNWSDTLFGNIAAKMDGEFLIIYFFNKKIYEPSNGKYNTILLNDVTKSLIDNIVLDFENCEGFTIYKSEILDMKLKLKKELFWGSSDLHREVESGYIKLKMNKKMNYRSVSLHDNFKNEKMNITRLKQRLCTKHEIEEHDICNLYVHYDYAGYGISLEECLHIEDIQDSEEIEKQLDLENKTGQCHYFYIGGVCKRHPDGSILIAFGETAKKMLKKR